MAQRQPAAGTHLRFVTDRQFDEYPRRHQRTAPRSQLQIAARTQIIRGVVLMRFDGKKIFAAFVHADFDFLRIHVIFSNIVPQQPDGPSVMDSESRENGFKVYRDGFFFKNFFCSRNIFSTGALIGRDRVMISHKSSVELCERKEDEREVRREGFNPERNRIMKKYWLISAAVFCSAVIGVSAAETSEFAKAQAQLKAKNPTEFAEIEKLAATDLAAAMEKMSELARKSDIRLPRTSEEGRRPMPGGRGEFSGRRGGSPGGDRSGMMMNFGPLAWMQAISVIQSKFPEEYAAIAAERTAADAKLTELAGKAKVTLPDTPELLLRKLEAADQAGCAEAVKLAGDDPRAAMRKINEIAEKAGISLMPSGMRRRFGGRDAAEKSAAAPPQMRENPMARLRELQRQYPEEMKQIAELRKSDPKKANEMLRDLEARSKEEAAAK